MLYNMEKYSEIDNNYDIKYITFTYKDVEIKILKETRKQRIKRILEKI